MNMKLRNLQTLALTGTSAADLKTKVDAEVAKFLGREAVVVEIVRVADFSLLIFYTE